MLINAIRLSMPKSVSAITGDIVEEVFVLAEIGRDLFDRRDLERIEHKQERLMARQEFE